MRLCCIIISISMILVLLTCCGEDNGEDSIDEEPEIGNIQGRITDKELGNSIKSASVDIGGQIALTDSDGRYSLDEIPFADNVNIVVTADGYMEYKDTLSLDQELLVFDISLLPLESPSVEVLEVLEAFSRDIAALDPGKIPTIQSYLSEDYVAADNEATLFGVSAGVVPSNFDSLPETIDKIIEKYDELEFKFADPNVEFVEDLASVWMRFEVYAITKPPEPKEWEIILDGKLELQKRNGNWKIKYWELTELLKFDWKLL